MTKLLCIITLSLYGLTFAQTNTEVYLLDIKTVDGKTEIVNPRNISNNEGYDNQPSFYDEKTILFSSTRNGQTDIAKYDIQSGKTTWISNTEQGSEYSPLKIPGKNAVSAIRLDTTGLQRLYEYSVWNGNYVQILEGLKVAYHVWYDNNTVVSSVTSDDHLNLVVSHIDDGSNETVFQNVGRSLHRIPDSDLISFISKESDPWEIKSLNPKTGKISDIAVMFKNVDDMCWIDKETIIAADNKVLMQIHPNKNKDWDRFLRLQKKGINKISRIDVSPNGKYLSLVVEETPAAIVQNQVDAYNDRDIEAFLNTYATDVQVFDFPGNLKYTGKEKMREHYMDFFANTPDLNCHIKNRIVVGNKVIDKEIVTANGNTLVAVAIYEVENGKIAKVTFLK
ncbi:nuclear transport factor 2 family protein [Pareuzebyella sediminis]|uniref:nuclear transport factor 2 family protein n=1 Tax=Pareuzebyella sediminis TaxID=2607998 RepID=UPI0011EDAEE7|nr:nuclear transport factor 2 family protein [Pareuzebyella sediminis]